MVDTNVTVFFGNKSPPKHLEVISDSDADKLNKLEMCIYQLREAARKEGIPKTRKGVLKVFDNYALNMFIEELAILIDDIRSHKSIKNYIVGNKANFSIVVDLEED